MSKHGHREPSQSISKDDYIKRIPPLSAEIKYAPAAAYYPSFAGRGTLMFESVKGPHRIARYSFIAFEPYCEYCVRDKEQTLVMADGKSNKPSGHPMSTLRELIASYNQSPDPELPPFQGGAAGLISYDFMHYLERVPTTTTDDLRVPDLHMFLFDRLLAFDHMEQKAWAVICPGARNASIIDTGIDTCIDTDTPSDMYDQAKKELRNILMRAVPSTLEALKANNRNGENGGRPQINYDVTQEQYESMVVRAKEYIAAGDIFQANLSLRLSADMGARSPWDLYLALREINPSPFSGFLDFGDYVIAGSSPERLVMVRGNTVELRPIAGTRPRGQDSTEDERMRSELLLNPKERAEHIMLIDLERNDLGRVCGYGSVEVDELMVTEDYSHVIHIVSNVRGSLAPGKDCLDALKATFPGGTITGVPKVRCMEIIDELESLRRGPYTGSMGYLGFGGSMDINIIIRTFVIRDNKAYVQAGSGIVADSEPTGEYHESLNKAEALIKALTTSGGGAASGGGHAS